MRPSGVHAGFRKRLPIEGLRNPPQLTKSGLLHDPQAVDGEIRRWIWDEFQKVPLFRMAAHQRSETVASVQIAHDMLHPLGGGAADFGRSHQPLCGGDVTICRETSWFPYQDVQARFDKTGGEQVVMGKQHEELSPSFSQDVITVSDPAQPDRRCENADLRMISKCFKDGRGMASVDGNDDLDIIHGLAERGMYRCRNECFTAIRRDADGNQRLMAGDGGHVSKLFETLPDALHRTPRGGNVLARFNRPVSAGQPQGAMITPLVEAAGRIIDVGPALRDDEISQQFRGQGRIQRGKPAQGWSKAGAALPCLTHQALHLCMGKAWAF